MNGVRGLWKCNCFSNRFLGINYFSTLKNNPPLSFDYVGMTLFSSIVLCAGGLTVWQVQRYSWKKEMVLSRSNSLHTSLSNAPVNEHMNDDSLFAFRPLSIKGSFVPNTTFFLCKHKLQFINIILYNKVNINKLDPRSPPPAVMGRSSAPQVGAYVYTLLQRTDG